MSPILSSELPGTPPPLRAAITAAFHRDEAEHLAELLDQARLPPEAQAAVQATAVGLVMHAHKAHRSEQLRPVPVGAIGRFTGRLRGMFKEFMG